MIRAIVTFLIVCALVGIVYPFLCRNGLPPLAILILIGLCIVLFIVEALTGGLGRHGQ